MPMIKIINPGLFTTIQDRGRWGYQRFGMSVAGAMDHFSLRIGNMLVGNNEYDAALETTLLGPEILFNCDELISITGANMSPKINDIPVPMWTTLFIQAGDKLSFSKLQNGLRSYIAFSRGLDVPEIMGSKSTFIRGSLGGHKGRKLNSGDEIPLGDRPIDNTGSYLPKESIPVYSKDNTIRVIFGPQDDYFTDEAKEIFLNSQYTITTEADRMGYRLDGPKIQHREGPDIISDGIVFGSIQVPGHGSPIIMMADRQTTGGYTKIATVITPDLSTLSQIGPGNSMNFKSISIEESHRIYREYENQFQDIKEFIENHRFNIHDTRNLKLDINGQIFKVGVREIL